MKSLNRYKLIIMCLVLATGWSNTVSAQIIISEIMYDPCTSGDEQGADAECEYIEIFNSYTTPFDLCGATFTGVTYTFPCPTIINSGQYLVIARTNSMCNATPAGPEDYDLTGISNVWTSGGLGNNGGTIAITSSKGVQLSSVTYPDIVNNSDCQSVHNNGSGTFTAQLPSLETGTLAVGTTPAPNCEITNVMAVATCNGSETCSEVVVTWTEANTSGTVEVDVNGAGFRTLTSGGTYTLSSTTAMMGVTVTVRDECDNLCMATGLVDIPALCTTSSNM